MYCVRIVSEVRKLLLDKRIIRLISALEIKDMWLGRGTKSVEEAKRAAMKESKS